jgi:hypothetical protein
LIAVRSNQRAGLSLRLFLLLQPQFEVIFFCWLLERLVWAVKDFIVFSKGKGVFDTLVPTDKQEGVIRFLSGILP